MVGGDLPPSLTKRTLWVNLSAHLLSQKGGRIPDPLFLRLCQGRGLSPTDTSPMDNLTPFFRRNPFEMRWLEPRPSQYTLASGPGKPSCGPEADQGEAFGPRKELHQMGLRCGGCEGPTHHESASAPFRC